MGMRTWGVAGILCLLLVSAAFAGTLPAIVDEVQSPKRVDVLSVYEPTFRLLLVIQVEEDLVGNKVAISSVVIGDKGKKRVITTTMESGRFLKAGIVIANETEEAYLEEGYYVKRPLGEAMPPWRGEEEKEEYMRRVSIEFTDRPEEVLRHFLRMADEQVATIKTLNMGSVPFAGEMAWILDAPFEPERNSTGFRIRYDKFRKAEMPMGLNLNEEGGTATTWGALKAM